ncbi:wsv487 [White spot syndrome virus]|uniref:Wsv487 n=3 Tax=White spot syndrome virus TaxID=342409 RepID=Q8VAD8_WSSVS|nr:wsv487 [Shrimp white spot syndrome virus]AAL33488.1 wsv487 [Shrimp white spot syndrome virus]AAL88882.1 WSSV014 [Shrimp white spot syndrome virus]AFX59860.1 wsv487 [White spot syndrome virus]AWQ62710.1 wsv487 [Shrimp white spot syndrome virus]
MENGRRLHLSEKIEIPEDARPKRRNSVTVQTEKYRQEISLWKRQYLLPLPLPFVLLLPLHVSWEENSSTGTSMQAPILFINF